MLVNAHAGILKLAYCLDHERVHLQQLGHVEQAGADGFPIRPRTQVEEGPGREEALCQRTYRRTTGYVFFLGGTVDFPIRIEFWELRYFLHEKPREVLRRNIGSMKGVVARSIQSYLALQVPGNLGEIDGYLPPQIAKQFLGLAETSRQLLADDSHSSPSFRQKPVCCFHDLG